MISQQTQTAWNDLIAGRHSEPFSQIQLNGSDLGEDIIQLTESNLDSFLTDLVTATEEVTDNFSDEIEELEERIGEDDPDCWGPELQDCEEAQRSTECDRTAFLESLSNDFPSHKTKIEELLK